MIANDERLTFAGVQGFAGHAQHVHAPLERKRAAAEAAGVLRDFTEALAANSLPPRLVSGSGTGTYLQDSAAPITNYRSDPTCSWIPTTRRCSTRPARCPHSKPACSSLRRSFPSIGPGKSRSMPAPRHSPPTGRRRPDMIGLPRGAKVPLCRRRAWRDIHSGGTARAEARRARPDRHDPLRSDGQSARGLSRRRSRARIHRWRIGARYGDAQCDA
jgi:hypothetical protein